MRRILTALLVGVILSLAGGMTAAQSAPDSPLLSAADGAGGSSGEISRAALARHVRALSGVGSRLAGYPGHEKAEAYLRDELRRMGIEKVYRQSFRLPVPHETASSLTLLGGNESFPLTALWPDGVRTSMTPPGGFTGSLVDGGNGEFADYPFMDLAGSVVLLDWKTGGAWQNAAALGCRHIIFIEPETAYREEGESKFLRTPASVARFMVPRKKGLRFRELCAESESPPMARLDSEIRWEEREVANFVAVIPGSDPSVSGEALLLQAYYDASSVLPARAPGADQACGIAAALEIVREFAADPPRRSIIVLFTTAHFEGLDGIVRFVDRAEFRRDGSLTWPEYGIDFQRFFFVGLDLSSRSRRVAVVTSLRRNYIGSLGGEQRMLEIRSLARHWIESINENQGGDALLVNGLNRLGEEESFYSFPTRIPFSAEVVELRQENAVSLVTAEDNRDLFDSPHDTFERVDLESLTAQANICRDFVRMAADADELPKQLDPKPKDSWGRVRGEVLQQERGGGLSEGIPVSGALVTSGFREDKTWTGVRTHRLTFADSDGRFEFTGFEIPSPWSVNRVAIQLEAYLLDPTSGRITHAPDLGAGAHGGSPPVALPRTPDMVSRIYLFRCQPVDIFDLVNPRVLEPIEGLRLLRAKSNVEPPSYGIFRTQLDQKWSGKGEFEPLADLFISPGERFKVVATTVLGDPSFLLAGIRGDEVGADLGKGFRATADTILDPVAFPCAEDMYRIARHRTQRFAKYGIRNKGLDADLDRIEATLEEANRAAETSIPSRAMALARRAWGMAAGAYPGVKRTADDMVVAVMFYMIMLLPFSVFMERLVIGATDVRRRIGWAAAIFAGIFIIFRYVHPAFDITLTPFLVLLSFVILTLSVVVMTIVISKFEEQFQKMKEEMGELHQADIGRLSAAAMAFSLGVSNLRNRPVRTAFTSAALILMTFTVLAFSSIETYQGFHKRERPGKAYYNGFLVTDPAAEPLVGEVLGKLENTFPDAIVCPRVWSLPGQRWSDAAMRVTFHQGPREEGPDGIDTEEEARVRAALRLSPEERFATGVDKTIVDGRWFRDGEEDVCVIPSSLAEDYGIEDTADGDWFLGLFSAQYRIVGVFDEDAFQERTDLDGHPLSPIDFYVAGSKLFAVRAQMERRAYGAALVEMENIERLYPEQFIIVSTNMSREPAVPPTQLSADWDTYLSSVAIRFDDAETAEESIQRYAQRTDLILFSGLDGKRYEYSAHTGLRLSGSGGLFVPLLICGLIVFNTMLNAVFERRKEIGVLSSVGLAPTHIGFLFLGEACVYAIMAAVLGYLVGQGTGKILSALGLLGGLTLNFSAMTAVFTSAVITLIVIVSSLYPAYVGGKMAVPSVERRWKLPDPEADTFRIDLPFTIGAEDRRALVAYIREFVESHAEYVMADFHSAEVSVQGGEEEIRLRARVWPEPYDLGVAQWIEFRVYPSSAEGSFEVALDIRRLEGDVTSWTRTNRLFLKSIRKQFLFWRSLSPKQRSRYREMGEA